MYSLNVFILKASILPNFYTFLSTALLKTWGRFENMLGVNDNVNKETKDHFLLLFLPNNVRSLYTTNDCQSQFKGQKVVSYQHHKPIAWLNSWTRWESSESHLDKYHNSLGWCRPGWNPPDFVRNSRQSRSNTGIHVPTQMHYHLKNGNDKFIGGNQKHCLKWKNFFKRTFNHCS